jgi:hypothetical protein
MKISAYLLGLGLLVASGCGSSTDGTSTTSSETTSASSVIAGAIGGSMSATGSGGTQAMTTADVESFAHIRSAASTCPTYQTTAEASCEAVNGTMWLTYSSCSFGASSNIWNGIAALSLTPVPTPTPTGVACGIFPRPLPNRTLSRQYVTAAGSATPGMATLITPAGTTTTVDDATPNLGNFDSATIAANISSGYGSQVSFSAAPAVRTGIAFTDHISAVDANNNALFDHSVYTGANGSITPLTITETSGAATRTIAGKVTLYHNLLQIVGTSTVSVTHSDTCCFPISGTISTTFSAGTTVTTQKGAGATYIGKTETLTFGGAGTCGTATFTDVTGATSSVTLARCF